LGTTSIVSEPAAANHGNFVFMTGNWWAARSIDGGNSFSFVDPFSDFAFMCCDQDVVYNDKHDVWIWYRQGIIDASLGGTVRNNVKINVSSDDAATWCTITLTALDIDSTLTDHFLDYPNLQTTDDKLYITSNIFDNNFNFAVSATLLRFDLNTLKSCGSVPFGVFVTNVGNTLTLVNGLGISE